MKALLTGLLLCQAALVAVAQTSTTATPTANGQASAAGLNCGGVGLDEQERIKAEAPRHDLMLTFSTPGGAYLADVDVEISRAGKVVVQGRCDGPIMLVDLAPKGTYQVKAVSDGREQRKNVTIGGRKPARMSFVWPGPGKEVSPKS